MCMTTAAIITTVAAVVAPVTAATISAHGQSSAADTNAKATEDASHVSADANAQALAFQKQQYNEEQQRLTPYRNLGAGALGQLGSLYGISIPAASATPTTTTPTTPTTAAQPTDLSGLSHLADRARAYADTTTSSISPTDGNALVTVRAPTGETRQVSAAQAEYYKSIGATIVPTGAA